MMMTMVLMMMMMLLVMMMTMTMKKLLVTFVRTRTLVYLIAGPTAMSLNYIFELTWLRKNWSYPRDAEAVPFDCP